MKKPEAIKMGLECMRGDRVRCQECAYFEKIHTLCTNDIGQDALGLIQQLESKLNQAVEDIRMLGRTGEFICPVCAYYNHGEGTKGECVKCLTGDGFRWRGEKEEETKC